MKRVAAILLSGLMVLSLLAGCGSTGGSGSGSASGSGGGGGQTGGTVKFSIGASSVCGGL